MAGAAIGPRIRFASARKGWEFSAGEYQGKTGNNNGMRSTCGEEIVFITPSLQKKKKSFFIFPFQEVRTFTSVAGFPDHVVPGRKPSFKFHLNSGGLGTGREVKESAGPLSTGTRRKGRAGQGN